MMKYPGTDLQTTNLDWLLCEVRLTLQKLYNFTNLNEIKFADPIDWNISSQYEKSTIVIADGIAYISKQAVTSGISISNDDYWLAVFDLSSINAHQIVNVIDFKPALYGADDSEAVQRAFDYAAQHHAPIVSFKDVESISFKNVLINTSCCIYAYNTTINGIKIDENNERVYTFFNVNNPELIIKLYGATFVGGYSTGNNPTASAGESAIRIETAKNVVIEDCTFKRFNNRNYSPVPTAIVDRTPVVLNIHDVNDTVINRCVFENNYGEELIYILDEAFDREDINAKLTNCQFGASNTSVLDFIGNEIEISGNTYDYNYNGSLMNVFGLNVNIHNELVLGDFASIYDTCEETLFTNERVTVKNVFINKTDEGIICAAKNVEVDNISIRDYHSSRCMYIVMRAGAGGSTSFHKDVSTQKIDDALVTIKNVKANNSINAQLLYKVYTSDGTVNVLMQNCETGANDSTTIASIFATGCDLTMIGCVIHPTFCTSITDGFRIGIVSSSNYLMKSVKLIGCLVNNISNDTNDRLVYSASGTVIVLVGNIASAADTLSVGDGTVLDAANHNLS